MDLAAGVEPAGASRANGTTIRPSSLDVYTRKTGPGRDRTDALPLKRRLLYQLSYGSGRERGEHDGFRPALPGAGPSPHRAVVTLTASGSEAATHRIGPAGFEPAPSWI